MHVKWERQIKHTERGRRRHILVALLIEGCAPGKDEKANVLTRLGVIQERFLLMKISKTRAFHQGLFWVKVDRKLGELGIEEKVQILLEAQISKKVPRPAEDWALWGVTCIPRIDC